MDKLVNFSLELLQFDEPQRTSSPARPRMSIRVQEEDGSKIMYHVPVRASAASPDDTWLVVLENTCSTSVSISSLL